VGLSALTIIHGPRHSGKTRSAEALAARCRAAGRRVGGILAVATMVSGVKTQYSFLDLAGGDLRLYAVRRAEPIPPGLLAFQFLDGGLAFGCDAIRRAARQRVEVLIVDEIGPLEMGGGGLWEPVVELPGCYAGSLVLTVRDSLVGQLQERLRPALHLETGTETRIVSPAEADLLPC
jgi:iron complex transport system ATP-binding protein